MSQTRRLAIKDLKNSIKSSNHSNVCKTDSRIYFIFAKHILTFAKCIFKRGLSKLRAFKVRVTENLERSVHRKSKIPDKAQP